jgi:hypothetical protein
MSSLRSTEEERRDPTLNSPLIEPDYAVGNPSIPILHIRSWGGWASSVKSDLGNQIRMGK